MAPETKINNFGSAKLVFMVGHHFLGFFLQSDSCEKISSGFSAKSCAVLNFNAIWQPVIRLAKMRLGIW